MPGRLQMTNWNVDQPAVVYLRKLVVAQFPVIPYHWAAMTNVDPKNRKKKRVYETHPLQGVGGYNLRTTEHGNPSDHAAGRAADIYVNTRNPLLNAIGEALFAGFIANASALGMEQLIWNGQIWSSARPYLHPYHGNETHDDHVHISFSRPGSQRKPPLLYNVLVQARNTVDAQFTASEPGSLP
jgi:hypothetical protein